MIATPIDFRAVTNELANATWTLSCIATLFESGLVEQLREPRTADELAATCRALSASRIAKVLAVAATAGVVIADGERYQLAEGAKPFATGPMRATLQGDIRSSLMQAIDLVDTATGTAPVESWRHLDPRLLKAQGDASSVLGMMVKTQMASCLGDTTSRLERPGARMLDIGTGVGAIAIGFCRAFPTVRVVGLDTYDPPLAIARDQVARAGLGERIELRNQSADQLRDEDTYDFAWLPSFFVAPAMLPATLTCTRAALKPGAWIVVGAAGSGDARQRAVWELVGDLWGSAVTAPTVEALMNEAGFQAVRVLPGPPWAPGMVVGQR